MYTNPTHNINAQSERKWKRPKIRVEYVYYVCIRMCKVLRNDSFLNFFFFLLLFFNLLPTIRHTTHPALRLCIHVSPLIITWQSEFIHTRTITYTPREPMTIHTPYNIIYMNWWKKLTPPSQNASFLPGPSRVLGRIHNIRVYIEPTRNKCIPYKTRGPSRIGSCPQTVVRGRESPCFFSVTQKKKIVPWRTYNNII